MGSYVLHSQNSGSHGVTIDVIGAPTWLGCDRRGPEEAPDTMRRHGLLDRLRGSGVMVNDLGDLPLPPVSDTDKFSRGRNMKYLDAVTQFDLTLAEKVYHSVSVNSTPVVLGGDHSVALGSISGCAAYHDDLGVIWFDAHGDINTNKTSPSGNLHGMCLSALMGFGDGRLTTLYNDRRKVDPRNVFLVGIRSLDPGEVDLIEREGIKVYYMKDIRRRGIEAVTADLISHIRGRKLKALHCSIDIDVVDPFYAPGTGTTFANGMYPDDLKYAIDRIGANTHIASWDLVELNPLLDIDNKTVMLSVDILERIARSIENDTVFSPTQQFP